MKIDKQTLFRFLKRLNKQLSNKFIDLKADFEKNPPANNEIKKRFLEWRTKYDQLVINTLKEVQQVDQKTFNFKDFIVKATEQLGSDSEFMQLLKSVNGNIQNLKDYIRMNLIRDPTIYEIHE